MQTIAIQSTMQPFNTLVQANVDLMSKFVLSPEVIQQAVYDAQKLLQQAQQSAAKLVQTHAFAAFIQGLMENYSQFLTELTHAATATFSQSQAALMHQAKEATDNVVDTAQASVRRVRSAA